ncbi:molybdopterin-binding protein [Chitinivorax sp. B]|uniref:competence/damage-inducible protein A n=1 Tax=Chitinivorax sp. B TaxID=2502235 RepID=UPI0010F563E1|nr:molybdopterin-binding protein [Chitinivorax sp. B]
MVFGAIIIGDEILSGKREDKHLRQVITELGKHGHELAWAHYLGDDRAKIVETLKLTMTTDDVVLCFGGIGATPDDHTRHAAALAANVPLIPHPEAVALIERQFGEQAHPYRVLMGELPAGCTLIPNPINNVAGFCVGQHHFLPGFPQMAWPMMAWVLETFYSNPSTEAAIELTLIVPNAKEGDLIPAMQTFVAQYPTIRFSSLPSFATADRPPQIEFGIRGPNKVAEQAMQAWREQLQALGYPIQHGPHHV